MELAVSSMLESLPPLPCFPKYPEPEVIKITAPPPPWTLPTYNSLDTTYLLIYLPTYPPTWTLPTCPPTPSKFEFDLFCCLLLVVSERTLSARQPNSKGDVCRCYHAPRSHPPPPPFSPLSLSLSLCVRHCRTCLVGTTIINRKYPPNPQDVISFAPHTHTHTHHFPSFFSALVAVVAGSFFPLPERVRALLLLLLGLGFFLFFFFPPFFPFQNE